MLPGDCSTPGVLWLPVVLRVGAERATAALVAHEGGLCVVDRQAPPPQRLPQVMRLQLLLLRLLPAQLPLGVARGKALPLVEGLEWAQAERLCGWVAPSCHCVDVDLMRHGCLGAGLLLVVRLGLTVAHLV